MKTWRIRGRRVCLAGLALIVASAAAAAAPPASEDGFIPLFDGKGLAHWKVPEGDNGHWKVVDGVIDYDARSEAKGSKDLVSKHEFGDFVLKFERRIKETPFE